MGSARTEGGAAHLRFEKQPLKPGCKLNEYAVINDQFQEQIGIIHFRGGWRQYVFQAQPGIDMSRSCHREIDAFIDKLMAEWSASKKK
jgi:hypothetical protein